MKDRQERPRTTGRGRTILAFALGAATGSLVALLYAPASGEVTRRRLLIKAREAKRAVTRKMGQAQKVLARKADQVRETATDWITEHVTNGHAKRRRQVLRHA